MPKTVTQSDEPSKEAREREARLAKMPFVVYGGKRGGLFAPIVELWSRRELLGLLVRRELKVRYKDSSLGFAWSLIRPLTTLLIYYVAIGQFLGASRSIAQFGIFVYAGLTIWGLNYEIITVSTLSILTNAGLIKKVYLPREIFPLAAAGSALVNFGVQLGVLLVVSIIAGQAPILANLGYGLAAFVVVLLFAVALGLLLSALNVYLRDVQYLVEVALLVLFWASPIVYSWKLVQASLSGPLAWLQELYLLNPMTLGVIAFQKAFWRAGDGDPLPSYFELRLLIAAVVGVVVLWFAQRVFTRLQGNFAQEI